MKFFRHEIFIAFTFSANLWAAQDLPKALRRAQYTLNGTTPTDKDISSFSNSTDNYRGAVRNMLNNENFYRTLLRYHERVFGVGLQDDYLQEFETDATDKKRNKIASISCQIIGENSDRRYKCKWASDDNRAKVGTCPEAWEEPVSAFWYRGIKAWVCPSVRNTCGSDLSRCFISYYNRDEAVSSEVGSTEVFDSSVAIMRSLSKQMAGIAASISYYNYPYTKILEPGLTAVDGAISHLYRQPHHFNLDKLRVNPTVLDIANQMRLTGSKFQLINTGKTSEQAGVLSTFGWLRRYEKNRTRANHLYQRLLCRKFTSDLPRVFPQDPGNLRVTPGCSGCHAKLDPLADFFKVWGEGGSLYTGGTDAVQTSFSNRNGMSVADLGEIIRTDSAFSTCTVQNVWKYLMGREFYHAESSLRDILTSYFVTTNYSMKELFYAIATHPAFTEGQRSDAVVGDPLEDPPLGQNPPPVIERTCQPNIQFTPDIQPKISRCLVCHNATNPPRQVLQSEADWRIWRKQAVSFLASGQMPPGQAGPPVSGELFDLKELVRCWIVQSP